MRKNNLKRAAALALAGAMVLSTAACGGGGNSANSTGDSQSTSGSETGTSESTGTGDKPVITFMAPNMYGTNLKNQDSEKVIALYEEHTNTVVEWQWESDDTYNEKLGLTLMDKDNMPMVLTAKANLTSNVVDAARKGAFWDLRPFLEDSESFPNLSQANENVMKALTVDGQIIGLYRARPIGRLGLSYRTDWAEAVGITEEPQTVEDVYDMLYKFTYEDPDGNGVDDTYGLEMTKYVGSWDVVQTWFGVGNEWVEEDGKLIPVHQTEEFMDALNWMKKIYDDGLVRRDWATIDSGTFSDACKKGEAGVYIDVMDSGKRIWNYFIQSDVRSVTNPDEIATMTLTGPINNKTLATSGFNGYYLITKPGAKTEEDVRNCLHFLDKMCDDEMIALGDYGMEGYGYDLNEEGMVVLRHVLEVQQTPHVGLNQAVAYIPNLTPENPPIVKEPSLLAQEEAYVRNEAVAVFNPALGYLANSEVNSEVGTDIEQIIDDARTQYICGQIDEAGFESAAKQWLDRGGDRLIEEVNALYQADPNK